MDSKTLRGALLIVTLFVLAMFLIVLAVNGVFERPSKGAASQYVSVNSIGDNPDDIADENGYIYGSDLSAWMYDDTFWDAEPIAGGKYLDDDHSMVEDEDSSIDNNAKNIENDR